MVKPPQYTCFRRFGGVLSFFAIFTCPSYVRWNYDFETTLKQFPVVETPYVHVFGLFDNFRRVTKVTPLSPLRKPTTGRGVAPSPVVPLSELRICLPSISPKSTSTHPLGAEVQRRLCQSFGSFSQNRRVRSYSN